MWFISRKGSPWARRSTAVAFSSLINNTGMNALASYELSRAIIAMVPNRSIVICEASQLMVGVSTAATCSTVLLWAEL